MRTRSGNKCPHDKIQYCPLYVGMHIADGPSCWHRDLENGCAVDHGASYEALVAKFFRAHPKDFEEVTIAERKAESREQRERNLRLNGLH